MNLDTLIHKCVYARTHVCMCNRRDRDTRRSPAL